MPRSSGEPLAYRMAPRTLAEFFGQRHLMDEGKMLRRLIMSDRLSSLILFGPPGSGKTSLARVIAASTHRSFRTINAVTAGIADIKAVIQDSQNLLLCPEGSVVLFIDEIHRFNKAQQDALLPSVENGSIILIGATTENPYFEVNKALISRSTVCQLQPLTREDLKAIIDMALHDKERGYGDLNISLQDEAKESLAAAASGDARKALNALELAVLTTPESENGCIEIDLDVIKDSMQQPLHRYDKSGEDHYNTISAFIKSMRGSDPDATVHYLARMIESGEDPDFIARRIVICAAEDVGMANPQILSICMSAWQAAAAVGFPEARIILSEAALLVACSPKSNSAYLAIDKALEDVRKGKGSEIPMALRNAPVRGMSDLGYGKAYKYAHDYPGHVADMTYLPEDLQGARYYEPGKLGVEKRTAEWLEVLKEYKNHYK